MKTNIYDTLTKEEKMDCFIRMFPNESSEIANYIIDRFLELRRYEINGDKYYYKIYLNRWNIFTKLFFKYVTASFYDLIDSITRDELEEYKKQRKEFLKSIGKINPVIKHDFSKYKNMRIANIVKL